MSLGSLSVSALTPGFFALLPVAIAALYWIYRQGGPRKVLSVPTLFLLKKYEGHIVSRQKFFPPPRAAFFVSLCFLLILIGGSLVIEDSRTRFVIVIDNSLSTLARSRTAGPVIEQLKSRARDFLEDRSTGLFTVYALCPVLHARSVHAELREALDAIGTIAGGYCDDKLEERAAELVSRHGGEELILFSERPNTSTSSTSSSSSGFRLVGTGRNEALANIAILALAVNPRISALVKNFSLQSTPVELTLEAKVGDSWQLVRRLQRSMIPASAQNVEFEDALPTATQAVRLKLSADPQVNSLSEDDQAFAVVTSEASGALPTIALLSPLSAEQLGLMSQGKSVVPGVTFSSLRKEAISENKAAYAALIVHRLAAPTDLDIPLLEVLSDASEREVQNPQITRWEKGSPLLTYLNLRTVHFDLLHPLSLLPGERTLISTTHGAALAATAEGKNRRVRMGFEIFPFEGARAPAMSILLLNTLRWLTAREIGVAYQHPYSDPQRSWTPGMYSEGAQATSVAVSFFSENESNTLDGLPWNAPALSPQSPSSTATTRQLSDWLSLLVLALLLAEAGWLAYRYRAQRVQTT